MNERSLTALPVYNEVRHVERVLDQVGQYSSEILVVNDGSSDGTTEKLAELVLTYELRRQSDPSAPKLNVVTHAENRGYGGALVTAFEYAIAHEFGVLVTIDCDGQHQPRLIPHFVDVCLGRGELPDLNLVSKGTYRCHEKVTALTMGRVPVDLVSGSRYLREHLDDTSAPPARRRVNQTITAELNALLDFSMTDAFCGFKAYRVEKLKDLRITNFGYAMPLELWVQAAANCFSIIELAVPRVYTGEDRSFGEVLDDADRRLAHYRGVIRQARANLAVTPCGEHLAMRD